MHKVSETECDRSDHAELHHVSVLGHFQVYLLSQFFMNWIGVFIKITQLTFLILVFFNAGGCSSVPVLCGTGIFFSTFAHSHIPSHSHVTIPISIPLPKLHVVHSHSHGKKVTARYRKWPLLPCNV